MHLSLRSLLPLPFLAAALSAACASSTDPDALGVSLAANTGGVLESTPEARAILRVVNEATEASLSSPAKAGLRAVSASAIVGARAGNDEVLGTVDDRPFSSLAQLDAVPFVGPAEFQRLLAYARTLGYVEDGVAPCTFERAFKSRFGHDYSVDDVAFLTEDGRISRGLVGLALVPGTERPQVGGSPVKEIRLLGPQVYNVLATLSRSEFLAGLGHAIALQGTNEAWAKTMVATTLLRQFVFDEPTAPQLTAVIRVLVTQAEAQVPAADRAGFRVQADDFARGYENGATPLSGGVSSRVLGGYTFTLATFWGQDPSLGFSKAGAWGTFWTGLAAAPKCDGCVTVQSPIGASGAANATYVYCDAPKTWAAAENACASRGGHLTSVESKVQQALVRSLAPGAGNTWIGLYDPLENGVYTWSDEKGVGYLNWYVGQPDAWEGKEHCVHTLDRGYWASWRSDPRNETFWNDVPCSDTRSFVCKL